MQGREEWLALTPRGKAVLKIGDIKLYECPLSAITRRSWDILRLVNDTTDAEGNILHLPFPGCYMEQPEWYRSAVRIVRTERAAYRAEKLKRG